MGKRRKQHAKPPEKYHFEKAVRNADYADNLYYRNVADESDHASSDYPLYPVSWGWNDSGRAGNITEPCLDEPKRVQQTQDRRFIACAAGKHHSLLVSEQGNVYSFGDNKHDQLGYGHPFRSQEVSSEPVQYYPRQVTPSGHLRYGRDYKVTEVSCGATFSVAREACHVDAVKFSKGMLALERALAKLLRLYPDALPVQMASVKLRQERYMFSRAYGGQVMAWGAGMRGELGLGRGVTHSSIPRVLPAFRSIQITQIASGNQHSLAIDTEGRLFSWGCGRSGQLGHDNGENCFEPKLVAFFEQYYVEQCAAGRSHSAVLMTSRKSSGDRNSKLKRLATFGRGAHGRLGVGHNKSLAKPTLVTVWPPTVRAMSLVQVACGGAHTVVLSIKGIPRSLSNPIGVETTVLTFGFGKNGQLGTGYIDDHEFYPVKVKLPRWEVISEVSAGKSWTLARTVNGELFGWGKGLRGQLGLQNKCMSVAPRNLNVFASALKISSGYAHNLCIAAPKKYHNSKIVEKAMPALLDQEAFVYNRSLLQQNRACDLVQLCLSAGEETRVLGTIGCCKVSCPQTTLAGRLELEQKLSRAQAICKSLGYSAPSAGLHSAKSQAKQVARRGGQAKGKDGKDDKPTTVRVKPGKVKKGVPEEDIEVPVNIITRPVPPESYVWVHPTMRYMRCLDCQVSSACMVCIRICHANHRVCHISGAEAQTALDDKSLYCHCSALHPGCRVMPFIPEVYEGPDVLEEDDYYTVDTQNKINNEVDIYHPRSMRATAAATCIQRLARAYFGKLQLAKLRAYVLKVRREACRRYWETEVLGEIWSKLDRTYETYRDSAELLVMRVEEERGRAYNDYYYLQAGLKGMSLLNKAIDKLIAECSLYFPNKSLRPEFDLDYNHKHLSIEDFEENMQPTRPKSTGRKLKSSAGSRFKKKVVSTNKNPGVTLASKPSVPQADPHAGKDPSIENKDVHKSNQLALVPASSPASPERGSKERAVTPSISSKSGKQSKSGKTPSIRTAVKSSTGAKSSLAISKAALAKPSADLAPVFGHELFAPPVSNKHLSSNGLLTGSESLFEQAFGCGERDDSQSTRAFCWNSARSLQLRLPLSDMRRLTPAELALASKHFPYYVSPTKERNLLSCDADIGALASRFVSDVFSENRRYVLAKAVATETQKKDVKRLARRRAKVAQQNRAAEAANRAKNAEIEREAKKKADAVKRATLASQAAVPVVTKKKQPPPRVIVEKPPPLPKLVIHRELPPDRRKSISDPCNMTARLESAAKRAMDLTSGAYGFSLRRPSLPIKLSRMRPRVPLLAYAAQTEVLLDQSLELFSLRLGMLFDCLASPLYVFPVDTGMAAAMLRYDPNSPQTNVRRLMEFSFLNPRLPCELNEMLVHDNKRRHTIAEPERLAKQLKLLYQTRSCFATIRHQAKRGRFGGMEASHIPKLPSMPFRRRSFDMGEEKDLDDGVTERLGYKYEPIISRYTIHDLKKQSEKLQKMVDKCAWNDMGRAIPRVQDFDDNGATAENGLSPSMPGGGYIDGVSSAIVVGPQILHWQQYFGEDPDVPYYHCVETGETTWDEPFGDNAHILTRHDNAKGNFFWFNTVTGESIWDE